MAPKLEILFKGTRSASAIKAQWNRLKGTYQAVKAYEEFTGGGGDPDLARVKEEVDNSHGETMSVDTEEFVRTRLQKMQASGETVELTFAEVRVWQKEGWYELFHNKYVCCSFWLRKVLTRATPDCLALPISPVSGSTTLASYLPLLMILLWSKTRTIRLAL